MTNQKSTSTKYGATSPATKSSNAAFSRRIGISFSISLLLAIGCCSNNVSAQEHQPSRSQKEPRLCPLPASIALTVYNNGLGLVKDVRTIDLENGINLIRCEDIAAKIEPASVSLHCLSAPDTVSIREQSYQYDLLDPATILSKSIGKQVRFRHFLASGGSEEISGTLLSAPDNPTLLNPLLTMGNAGPDGPTIRAIHEAGVPPLVIDHGLVLKTPNAIVLNPVGQVELSELPEDLISKPSLLWKLEASKAGKQTIELTYQTRGLNWHCDYIFVVGKDDADLNAWVTLDNQSGTSYKNASLKLVAGNVHRVQPRPPVARMMALAAPASDGSPMQPQFSESQLADYHIYSLQHRTDLNDNETKQLALFDAGKIITKKMYVFDADLPSYGVPSPDNPEFKNVKAKLEFINSEANNLGIAMPAGKVRVYKRDNDGAVQFIGEDEIRHTPKDEKVRLFLGDATDIIGQRTQTSVQQVNAKMQRSAYEITLRNHTDSDVTVTDIEQAPTVWKVVSSSMPYTKKDAHTFEFAANVPANGETKIDYTIEMRSY